MISTTHLWIVILTLGAITFVFRSSFLILFAGLTLSKNVERYLRYVGVAIIPAMIAQLHMKPMELNTLIVWIISSIAALVVGIKFKSPLASMIIGAIVFTILKVALSFGKPF